MRFYIESEGVEVGNDFAGVSIGASGGLLTLILLVWFGPFEISIGNDLTYAFFHFGVHRLVAQCPKYVVEATLGWVPLEKPMPIEEWRYG